MQGSLAGAAFLVTAAAGARQAQHGTQPPTNQASPFDPLNQTYTHPVTGFKGCTARDPNNFHAGHTHILNNQPTPIDSLSDARHAACQARPV